MGFHMASFFRPRFNGIFLIRVVLIALAAYGVFGHLLIPMRIQGESMAPTYANGGFNFCWRPAYLFRNPQRFDVVAIRLAGRRVILLKRVVGLPGESVAFRKGILYINDQPLDEPHVRYRADWEMAQVEVAPDQLFVVGDNRGVPMDQHRFGGVERHRILGEILW